MIDPLLPLTTRRRFLTTVLGGAGALFGLGARRDTAAASPPGRLALYNTHTRETLDVTFRDAGGLYDARALAAIDHVLRCHYTGLATHMDIGVLEFLSTVDRRFGGDREIHVISGFRSSEYNDWLIRHGHGVARRSLHLVGRAIDVRLPGVPLRAVRDEARALGLGGVGYYPASEFVHLDSGPARSW
jgi:uncharacterized protein YcbK (DUF882 family)